MVYHGLTLRKHADRSTGERIPKWDPDTGEKRLFNPHTDRYEPWPLAGVTLDHVWPNIKVPTKVLGRWVGEGFVTVTNSRWVVRPGGPPEDPYRVDPAHGIPHTFMHVDSFTFHLMGGTTVTYKVVHQPDKYHDGPHGTDSAGDPSAQVDHFYLADLVP